MKVKLKPCPFCGNKNVAVLSAGEIDEQHYYGTSFAVLCDHRNGGCGATAGYRISEEDAIKAWNRRTE